MSRCKKTHADCDWAKTIKLDEWRDRWGQAHEHETIECRLPEADTFGQAFTATDAQPTSCGWARIKLEQAKRDA